MLMTFTAITASKPACVTKEFRLKPDGSLDKQTSANVYEGFMRRVSVEDAKQFAQVLQGLSTDCCLMYGVPPRDARLVTSDAWVKVGRPIDALPRSKESTQWPEGGGILMLDYDAPKDGSAPVSPDELREILHQACPSTAAHDFVMWSSASSHIWAGDKELQGAGGQRIYLLVKQASDIPRAGKALNERLWALGYGRYEVSTSGSLLERPVFDGSVWQTNRIDFAAGAKCGPGLEQRRGAPVVLKGSEHGLLDTASAILALSCAEEAAAKSFQEAARAAVKTQAHQAREAWVEKQADKLVRDNPRLERGLAIKQVMRAADRRELMGDWVVCVQGDDGQPREVTVGEMLDTPDKYHGRLTLDPLEPTYDGGRWVGKLFLYSARPVLHSMAHGGATFRLSRQPQRIEVVKGKGSETTDALLGVLQRAPDFFDFGAELVMVEPGGMVHQLNEHGLRYEAGRLTQFWFRRVTAQGQMLEELQDPPPNVCRNVLSLGERRGLKKLDAVITAPTLRPDGSVLATPGYDSSTRMLYDCDAQPIEVLEYPSREEALQALDFLWHPFTGFPFVGALDRAVHLAALITAAVRPILPTSPAFGYDAPVQGSGKTLLARCVGVLTEGCDPSVWPHTAGRDDEEVRKRLFTVLRTGSRCMIWDNVVGRFDSAALASPLTSPTFSDRILGASMASTVPNRAVFVMTGNNLTLAGDLPRRVLLSRIDPQTDKPFARSFSLDPVAYCKTHRQRMISSSLVLVRAMLTLGCEQPGKGKLASFEDWDAWVRQTVIYANELRPGQFGDVMDVVVTAQSVDPEQESLHHLLEAWVEEVGLGQAITASELMQRVNKGYGSTPLKDAMEAFARGPLSSKGISQLLRYRDGRVVGGKRLESLPPNRGGARRWRVGAVDVEVMPLA